MALDPNIGKIKFLRTKTPDAKPSISSIEEGELAINLTDRTIFSKNGNNIVDLGFGKGGVVDGDVTIVKDLKSNRFAISSTDGVGQGINLYGGYSEYPGLPLYGFAVAKSSLFGNHGAATSDWNQYLTMGGDSNRAWIFRNFDRNVASISTNGIATFSKVVAPIEGNASSASKLQTPRTISVSGSGASGSISFDGSSNVSIPLNVITQASSSNDTSIATTAFVQTMNNSDTGGSETAIRLKSPRNINGVSFNGANDISINRTESIRLGFGQDLNNYISEGHWYCDYDDIAATIKNSPIKLSFNLEVKKAAGVIQILSGYTSAKLTFKRYYYGVWSEWYRIYSEVDPQPFANAYYNGDISNVSQLKTATKEGTYRVLEVDIVGLYRYGILNVIKSNGTITQMYIAHNTSSRGSVAVRQTFDGNMDVVTPWRVLDYDEIKSTGIINRDITINDTLTVKNVIANTKININGQLNVGGDSNLANIVTSSGEIKTDKPYAMITSIIGAEKNIAVGGLSVSNNYAVGNSKVPNLGIYAQGGIFSDSKIESPNFSGINNADSTFKGNLTGNSLTSTRLQSSRKINTINFDGSIDISINRLVASSTVLTDANNPSGNASESAIDLVNFDSTANLPSGPYRYMLHTRHWYDKKYNAQMLYGMGDRNSVFYRGLNGDIYTTWREFAFTDSNVSTASKLQTHRTISVSGSGASGSISFDGSSNVSIPLNVITQASSSNDTSIATTAFVQTMNNSDTGSSATTLRLKNPRKINGVDFNGANDITIQDATKLPLVGGTLTGSLDVKSKLSCDEITSRGDVTAFSDIRLKDDIKTIDQAITKVSKLNGVTFTRNDINDDNNRRYLGLIAQDVLKVVPEAVSEIDDLYAVNYQGLVGLLVEAIKELNEKVEKLNGIAK